MKPIADIRIYRSGTHAIDNKPLHLALRRIAMKLRESGFSLGDFDHLYLSLTTSPVPGGIAPIQTGHGEPAWLRSYDVQITQSLYDQLGSDQSHGAVFQLVEETLTRHFASPAFPAERIQACITKAITQGETMEMAFKTKVTTKRKAALYLRLLDSGSYHPLLRVWDAEDQLLLECDLPRMISLDALDDLQLSLHKVTIKPRKSSYSAGMEPLVFEY